MRAATPSTLAREELSQDEVTMVYQDGKVIAAVVPASIWFQIQGFVARVIERL